MNKKIIRNLMEWIKNEPYVFLDIDGCLIPDDETRILRIRQSKKEMDKEDGNWLSVLDRFDPSCVDQINRIVATTDAKVILSSNWRRHFTMEQMKTIFRFNGIKFDLYDKTDLTDSVRSQKIADYVFDNRLSNYIVIDDMPLNIPDDRFIKCDSQTGLTKKLADKGIEILTRL